MHSKAQVSDGLKLLGLSVLISAVLAIVLAWGFFAFVFPSTKPPKEKQVIENFYAHRATFERLREMLIEDKKLVRVAGWGVETSTSMGTREHPTGDFPINRYHQYLALLKEVGGIGAHRDRNDRPADVSIRVYASGWAGDTRHVDVCWEDQVPTNQVSSLDEFYKSPKPRKPAFRHIDGNWYLWADW